MSGLLEEFNKHSWGELGMNIQAALVLIDPKHAHLEGDRSNSVALDTIDEFAKALCERMEGSPVAGENIVQNIKDAIEQIKLELEQNPEHSIFSEGCIHTDAVGHFIDFQTEQWEMKQELNHSVQPVQDHASTFSMKPAL